MLQFEPKLCFDNYANSKFRFIVKNYSKMLFYIQYVAETFFLHFPVQNDFSNSIS
ncbi:Uncharacterised protein [Campylobacter gracilis]|nr:Uncharacterised protein [Campylobacter gracilis]